MPIRDLKSQIARLPEQPGVYIYTNAGGETLYVGKARVLRDRVRSYLGAYGTSPRHDALLNEADRVETIVTDSVVEALALENRLIKQRQPRYNVLLRDDKTYPYLQLTTTERTPRVLIARRVERDGNAYFGPFMPAWLGRRTMSLTHRLFGIRSCNEVIDGRRPRPCLEYDIKRCLAPCVGSLCSETEYGRAVEDTRLFLEGRNDELLADLRARMTEAAAAERYEQAAQLRDAIRTIETVAMRQQKMESPGHGDRDAFGLKAGPAGASVQVFQMRKGRVIERVELFADGAGGSELEILEAAIQQFYEARPAPPEIHVPLALGDVECEALETWLTGRAGRKVRLVVPRRGDRRGLLELATRNAAVAYNARFNETVAAHYDALETLRAVLNLPTLPRRIECFDISTIHGAETVASMVVCEDGRMKRGEYRKYRIRGQRPEAGGQGAGVGRLALGADSLGARRPAPSAGDVDGVPPPAPSAQRPGPDDFAAMREVVQRRYRKLLEQGGPFPDLVLIDGGKGQLSAAYEALESLGLANLVAVGIAKKEELLFTRDHANPIGLPADSPALLLIQRIRDEAHRFAVTFHRKARAMRDLRSGLDEIPGIGPRRRRALLTAFGSLAGVRRATREELVRVVGAKAADAVLAWFAANS
jgi:excinuclease ABC subunit C